MLSFHLDLRFEFAVLTQQDSVVAMQFFHELFVFPVSWMAESYSLAPTDARGHAAPGRRGARWGAACTTGSSTPTMVVWSAILEAVLELKALFDLGQLCVHSGVWRSDSDSGGTFFGGGKRGVVGRIAAAMIVGREDG